MITVSDHNGELDVLYEDHGDVQGSATFVYGPVADVVWYVKMYLELRDAAAWIKKSGAQRVGYLKGVEVWEDRRGGGVGTALVRRGLSEMAKRDVEIVCLHALASTGYEASLARWYTKLGFNRQGVLDGVPFFYMYLDDRPKDRPTKRRASRRRSSRR